jgi:hypothetical protein
MKTLLVLVLLPLAACNSGMPPPLPQTPKDAAVWDLNQDRWPVAAQSPPGTNDLVKAPQ